MGRTKEDKIKGMPKTNWEKVWYKKLELPCPKLNLLLPEWRRTVKKNEDNSSIGPIGNGSLDEIWSKTKFKKGMAQ